MNDFLKDLQNTFMARVKNMLLLNFIIAWCIVNYKIVLRVVFEETDINTKISYLNFSEIGFVSGILLPLLFTVIYIYVIPFLNLYVVIWYNKFVNTRIQEHKKETLKDHYKRQREVEKEKLETTIFLKDSMDKEKKAEQLKQEKEEISLEERKIKIFEKSNKLKLEENNQKARELELHEKEKMILTDEYNKLKSNVKKLELDYSILKNKIEISKKEMELINNPKYTFSSKDLKNVYNKNEEFKGLGNINIPYSDNINSIGKVLNNVYSEIK